MMYHVPVLLHESVEGLNINPKGIYIDATFGGGGHSTAILKQLDGGHLLYYIIEWVRGKPLSEHVQTMGLKIGLCIMGLFMLVAFFNDFTRIFG